MIESLNCNFPTIIDAATVGQIQRRVRWNQSVQVGHHAVFPEKGTAVEIHVARVPNHLSFGIDVVGYAQGIPRKRARSVITPFCQRKACVVVSPGKSEIPTTAPPLLVARAALFITPPKPPRSVTEPFCHSTA